MNLVELFCHGVFLVLEIAHLRVECLNLLHQLVDLSSQCGCLGVDINQVSLDFTSVLVSKCFLLVFDTACHHLKIEDLLLEIPFIHFGLNLRSLFQLVLLLFNDLDGTFQTMIVTSLFNDLLEMLDETILLLLDTPIKLLLLLIDRELL